MGRPRLPGLGVLRYVHGERSRKLLLTESAHQPDCVNMSAEGFQRTLAR